MKKIIAFAFVLAFTVVLCAAAMPALASQVEAPFAYVTVSGPSGELEAVSIKVELVDFDNDGKLTVYDALYAAHEEKYPGGAAAGFAVATGDYGLYITKLWGGGMNFGYYKNNESVYSLTDEVERGDYISAFVYTDTVGWSDTYCYFDMHDASVENGGTLTLTLLGAGYDESFNPVTTPVVGADIYISGKASGVKTDENGKATLTFKTGGAYTVSAKSDSQNLVPPVCVVTVAGGGALIKGIFIVMALIIIVGLPIIYINKRRNESKQNEA